MKIDLYIYRIRMNLSTWRLRQAGFTGFCRTIATHLVILCGWTALFGQANVFSVDSIPSVNGGIVFDVDFPYDLSKEEFNVRINLFLSKQLNPVTGEIMENNPDHTSCRVVDYIGVGDNIFHSYGIYMIYNMNFDYENGMCRLTINNIEYLDKGYIDAFLDPLDKRDLPTYTAVEIMVDHQLKELFVRHASLRITEESIARINGIIGALDELFGKEIDEP